MSTHSEVRALLEQHGLHAKKALGQNFLVDEAALDAIAASGLRGTPRALIEIGPGPGTLTERLARSGLPLIAIEKDRDFVEVLRARFADAPQVSIVQGDVLEVDWAALHPGLRSSVIGNIPYNISTPIFLMLLGARAVLGPITLMVQKEVGERLMAEPSTKAYGSLSVLFQALAELEKIRLVPAGAFFPAPKVDSVVLRMTFREAPLFPIDDLDHFQRAVRAAFSLRRKMLRNSLQTAFSKDAIDAASASTGIALTRRAESLTLSEFGSLAAALPRALGPLSPSDPL